PDAHDRQRGQPPACHAARPARVGGLAIPVPSDQANHILVVDDDRRIRELLSSFLTEHGYRVTAAVSAPDARRKMRGLAFDLIVLDIMMKGETGIELTRALRGDANGIPILMLSALAESADRIK